MFLVVGAHGSSLVPQEIVESHLKGYGAETLELIEKDRDVVSKALFYGKTPVENPEYLATVGGVGASKSTILDRYYLMKDPNYVLSDPDQGALVRMIYTYIPGKSFGHFAMGVSVKKVLEGLYDKWRGASNYISNDILNKAYQGRYNIAHGTTSQGMPVASYQKLKENGYRIHLILCAAPDATRQSAVEHREKYHAIVQSTADDWLSKVDVIYKRLRDYFDHADQLDIFWTQDFEQGSILAAVFKKGRLTVKDKKAYEAFLDDYNQRAVKLDLAPFESILVPRAE